MSGIGTYIIENCEETCGGELYIPLYKLEAFVVNTPGSEVLSVEQEEYYVGQAVDLSTKLGVWVLGANDNKVVSVN